MALFENEPIVEVSFGGQTLKVPASVAAQLAIPQQQGAPDPLQISATEYGLMGSGTPGPKAPPPPPPPIKQIGQAPGGIAPPTSYSEMPGVPSNNRVDESQLGVSNPIGNAFGAIDRGVNSLPQTAMPEIDGVSSADPRAAGTEGVVAQQGKPGQKRAPGVAPGSPQDTVEGALGQTNDALRRQEEAGRKAAAADSIGQAVMAGAYEDQLKRTDELMAARNKEMMDRQKAIETKMAQAEAAATKYANAKVDRTADHPIAGLIGAVLAGLGSAMKGDGTKNVGLDALTASIERKVNGQIQDIERQGKVVGMMREGIQGMQKVATDQLALRNLMIAGEAERTAVMIKKIAAQTNSEVLKTRGDELAGQLLERSATARMSAVNKQIEVDTHNKDRAQRDAENKRQVGLGYANLGENKRQFDLGLKDKKEERDAMMAKAIMEADKQGNTARSKLLADAAKENSQRAVGNAITGDYLLQPGGKKQFDEAAKLEKQAAELDKTNKPAADAMRAKATAIRTDVLADEANGVWRVASPDSKAKIADGYASAQQVASLSQEIKQLAMGKPKSWVTTDEGRAAIQAKMTSLTMHLKNSWGLGVLSKQDTALINEATGGDPTKLTADQVAYSILGVGKDPDAFGARLDALGADVKKEFLHTARAQGYRGDAKGLFGEETTPVNGPAGESYQKLFGEKNIDQQMEGAARDPFRDADQGKSFQSENGLIENTKDMGRGVKGVAQKVFFGGTEQDKINARGEFEGSFFTKNQAAAADDLIARAKKNDPEAQKLLMQAATDPNIGAAITGRMRNAGMTDLANAATTANGGKVVNDASISLVPPHELGARASIGDREAMKELGKLSAAGNDVARRYLKAAIDYRSQHGYAEVPTQDDFDRARGTGTTKVNQ